MNSSANNKRIKRRSSIFNASNDSSLLFKTSFSYNNDLDSSKSKANKLKNQNKALMRRETLRKVHRAELLDKNRKTYQVIDIDDENNDKLVIDQSKIATIKLEPTEASNTVKSECVDQPVDQTSSPLNANTSNTIDRNQEIINESKIVDETVVVIKQESKLDETIDLTSPTLPPNVYNLNQKKSQNTFGTSIFNRIANRFKTIVNYGYNSSKPTKSKPVINNKSNLNELNRDNKMLTKNFSTRSISSSVSNLSSKVYHAPIANNKQALTKQDSSSSCNRYMIKSSLASTSTTSLRSQSGRTKKENVAGKPVFKISKIKYDDRHLFDNNYDVSKNVTSRI